MKQEDVEKYINAVSDLTDSLQSDIIKGNQISTETVVALSRLHQIAQRMKALIEFVERRRIVHEQ